ncbi:hypothetical protein [Sinomonas cyclohexanicum]|nr:hypothetical protein [Corynebacterium cyclohexanicum]
MTEEDAFPAKAEFSASIDLSRSQLSKNELISELGDAADSSGVKLARVIADPQDFFHSRSLYFFGSSAPAAPQDLSWFKVGMRGQARSAADIGTASLSGAYVGSGPVAAQAAFDRWLTDHGMQHTVTRKSSQQVLQQSLVTTGAWLAFLTCTILLVALVIGWYVLRAKARTLKILGGAPAHRILIEDLVSLAGVTLPGALLGVAGACIVVAAMGRAGYLPAFIVTALVFLSCCGALLVVCALLVTAFTWPAVAAIAGREPPERHFTALSEILKVAALIVVAAVLPVVGASIAEATRSASDSAQWSALSDQVTIRAGFRSDAEFVRSQASMTEMANAAAAEGHLAFAYAVPGDRIVRGGGNPGDLGGHDGFAMVDQHYLEKMSGAAQFHPSAANPLGSSARPTDLQALPPAFKSYIADQYPLISAGHVALDAAAAGVKLYSYTGTNALPVLGAVPGDLLRLHRPLVLVVDDPAKAFNSETVASFLTTGNLSFDDASWVHGYLTAHELGGKILSVDTISDAALYNSQLQNQSAWMKGLSLTLVLLALAMSTAVSAWIHALSARRRNFVARTSGWSWARVLARRLGWECLISVALGSAVFAALNGGARGEAWWAFAAAPIYILASAAFHLSSTKTVFAGTLERHA